jgi:hypothetical protein
MGIFQSIAVAKLIFSLGIINLVTAALIFFSCRCLPGNRLVGGLMKRPAYKRLFSYHCYIWWVFWPSVVVHAMLAIAFFGIPV